MKISKTKAIGCLGFIWLAVGVLLLLRGAAFLETCLSFPSQTLFIKHFMSLFKNQEQGLFFIVSLGLFFGYLKGKTIFSKVVKRNVKRICSFETTIPWKELYPPKELILILSMMGLGILLKSLGCPHEIRGFVNIAVGTALILGSIAYFRAAKLIGISS